MRWSAREVGVVVPRQNGKGALIEARTLAGLVLFEEQLILHSAHEFKTANEGFLRLQQLIENCDDLRKQVLRVARANGEQGITLRNGSRLRFIARSKASGRGFSADLTILDEAYELAAQQVGALIPTMSARPNPQLWYLSSAPMATSEQLHKVRARALAGDSPELAYFEWSAPEDAKSDDREAWAVANPALGIRIWSDTVEFERNSMPDAEFRRERLGIPEMPPVSAGSGAIDPEVWARLADPSSGPVGQVAFVVDVSPNGKTAAIAMAGLRDDGLTHLELVDYRPGVDWVVARRAELEGLFPGAVWALDPAGPAVQIRSLGDWRELSPKDANEAFAAFVASVGDEGLRWRCAAQDHDSVWLAVQNARQQTYGDGVSRWSRRTSNVDIAPLVAMTLAVFAGRALIVDEIDPLKVVW
jgi:hypothetical protein